MGSSGSTQLDFEFLGNEAKVIALDVAAEQRLYLSPEALSAIDVMIRERRDDIERTWQDLNAWKSHVRHISLAVARIYSARGAKKISDREEFLERARRIYRVYPYD